MKIFMVQGAMIGVIGTLAGVLLGVLLGLNVDTVVPALEHVLGFKFLAKDVYYISELPSDVQARDVLTIGAVSLLLSFVATLYPSWRASRVNPAEALRYE
jgi:lipoprotein-releasing system permease protein